MIGVTPPTRAPVVLGSLVAPAMRAGAGGTTIAWPVSGARALVKLSLFHQFPPTNILCNKSPVLVRCNAPTFKAVRINGGCGAEPER